MPKYVYHCTECNGNFETVHGMTERQDHCELCSSSSCLRRIPQMPSIKTSDYDDVNWNQYKNDYILRTDAVWERTKLLDLFYTHYKSKFVYDSVNNRYMIANIR